MFCVLASGSSGNACYMESTRSKILIDAGLSGREIIRRLNLIGVEAESLDAIFLTHEHMDHIKGAGPLSRRFDLPVYLTEGTLERGDKCLGKLPKPVRIHAGEQVVLEDVTVETFTKCHDASDPLGLVVCSNGKRFGVATDLGRSTGMLEDHLRKCQALILEFNHDPVMLEKGPYSLDLKKRIRGSDGHLSNDQAVDLLSAIGSENLRYLVLAHLSEINNRPEKAYECARGVLDGLGLSHVNVSIARQNEPGMIIEI